MAVLIHFIVSVADIFFILVLYYIMAICVNFYPGIISQPFYTADILPIARYTRGPFGRPGLDQSGTIAVSFSQQPVALSMIDLEIILGGMYPIGYL
jgi:hypothetical protein